MRDRRRVRNLFASGPDYLWRCWNEGPVAMALEICDRTPWRGGSKFFAPVLKAWSVDFALNQEYSEVTITVSRSQKQLNADWHSLGVRRRREAPYQTPWLSKHTCSIRSEKGGNKSINLFIPFPFCRFESLHVLAFYSFAIFCRILHLRTSSKRLCCTKSCNNFVQAPLFGATLWDIKRLLDFWQHEALYLLLFVSI